MCGRTNTTLRRDEIVRVAGTSRWTGENAFNPSYNAAPGATRSPVVRVAQGMGREICTMRWGLVPSYTKPDELPDFWRMFNARSETLAEKPTFQRLLSRQRCLVPVAGFYEWKKEARSAKQPYYVHFEGGRPMVMAGLWDTWQAQEGPMSTYTILTTDSGPRLGWLHDRMPVILDTKDSQDLWLLDGPGDPKAGTWSAVCGPYIGEDLVWHPVTPEMGSPKLQGPECCAELKRPTITQFFEKKSGAKRKTDSTPEDTPGGKLARNSDEVGETRGSQQISQMGSQPATPAPAIKKESPKPSDAVGAAEDAKGQGDRQDPIEKEEVVEEPTPKSSPQPKSKPSPAGKGGMGALSSPDPSEKQASITQFFSKKS
uniref:Embryonic stem cell-specific 5-hydroxymethylcytosine-binding protein n=1 Tax=Auxenochlorella protothecoides TaxID=3075 RepID=A0A1D2AAI6_AUXPR